MHWVKRLITSLGVLALMAAGPAWADQGGGRHRVGGGHSGVAGHRGGGGDAHRSGASAGHRSYGGGGAYASPRHSGSGSHGGSSLNGGYRGQTGNAYRGRGGHYGATDHYGTSRAARGYGGYRGSYAPSRYITRDHHGWYGGHRSRYFYRWSDNGYGIWGYYPIYYYDDPYYVVGTYPDYCTYDADGNPDPDNPNCAYE